MRRKPAPWARIKPRQTNGHIIYREKKKTGLGVVIAVLIVATIVLTVLRVPERIGILKTPPVQVATPDIHLTGYYNSLLAEITDMERREDWDGDGLENGADLYPRDIDADKNGISDGHEGKKMVSEDLPLQYKNTKLVVSNTQSGITKFRGDWYICSFAGWIAFEDEKGTPYVLSGDEWKEAEHEWMDKICYVNLSGGCRLRFSDSGKPDDRDIVIDAVSAECKKRPDERYSIANALLSQLEEIYTSVDNGKTVQISILTEQGEQLLIVYGYDKYGNLLVANTESFESTGKIEINIKAQVFWDGQKITMRSWFDFAWGELSSSNGNVLTVF